MATAPRLTDLCDSLTSHTTAGNGDCEAASPHRTNPGAIVFRRWFDRDCGALLGGIAFGVGGCLLGASMPCEHPVGVAASMIWWGIYLGCFGLGIGALLGLWADGTPASRRGDVASGNDVGLSLESEKLVPRGAVVSPRPIIMPTSGSGSASVARARER